MKVTPSALVNTLSGKTGGVVASHWKGRAYIRKLVKPANPKTTAQMAVRNSMKVCPSIWRSIGPATQKHLGKLGSSQVKSGFNMFTKLARAAIQAATYFMLVPNNAKITAPKNFAVVTGAGAAGTAAATWTNDVIAGYTGIIIAAFKLGDTSFKLFNEATLDVTATFTLTGLTPASTYQVYAALYNPTTGDMGTEFAGTVVAHA